MNVAHIDVSCSHCGGKFSRYKGRVNEAVKFGWRQYCSPKCQFKARINGEYKICQTCSKNIWRTPKETKKNLTGRYFCSTSCSAIFNNPLRVRAKKPLKVCVVENCNN